MNTFVLDAQTENLSVQALLTQAKGESIVVLDADGNALAFVLSPADREAFIYAQAHLDLERNRPAVKRALARRGGVTTQQLLERARKLADS